MKKVFIDTDTFVMDLRYSRDIKAGTNSQFLQKVRSKNIHGATSIFNLFEVCGILSFNFSLKELVDLYLNFSSRYKIQIFLPTDSMGNLQYDIPMIFSQIQKKQGLGDAQVSYVVEKFQNQIGCFVSWNARHFEGKLSVPVMTPEEFLKN